MTGLLLRGVGWYQRAISPLFPSRCRYYPTCSAYAAEALQLHGAACGSWLTLRRLARCTPFHPGGGADFVPEPHPCRERPAPSPADGRTAQQEARIA